MNPSTDDLCRLIKATAFAASKHRNQRRKDAEASPYINHPIALADLLANEAGILDPTVLCAAILHDTIEDTETTADELSHHFGDHISTIVMEVSDDKSQPRAVRKARQITGARQASPEAKLVKLADKISNLRDLLDSPPAHWSPQRKADYVLWSRQVVDALRGTHPGLEAIFDALCARHASGSEPPGPQT